MNKNYILMIFEGKKTEPSIVQNMKQYFLNESETQVVKVIYGTVIYKLYKDFFINGILDDDLDLFPLLKERIRDMNDEKLDEITREDISAIYLFFDYDGHSSNACDNKLNDMLELFDDEFDKGRLYISYPMVEALKHLKRGVDFSSTIEQSNKEYKHTVSINCDKELKHISKLNLQHWYKIIDEHAKKASFIIDDTFVFPSDIIQQKNIFDKQKKKYIDKSNKVAVLSSFPLFLIDYYGVDKFKGQMEVSSNSIKHKVLFGAVSVLLFTIIYGSILYN